MFETVCVTNRRLCREDFLTRLSKIAKSPVDRIILREKDLSEAEYLELARKALEICSGEQKELILHNYPNVAKKLSQRKIHLPLSALVKSPDIAKEFEAVGTSVHSLEELRTAQALGSAYVTAGHIFKTDCKRDLAPRGIEFLQSICDNSKIPVYAIGGITPQTLPTLAKVNSPMLRGVCIMSGFMCGEINPADFLRYEVIKL